MFLNTPTGAILSFLTYVQCIHSSNTHYLPTHSSNTHYLPTHSSTTHYWPTHSSNTHQLHPVVVDTGNQWQQQLCDYQWLYPESQCTVPSTVSTTTNPSTVTTHNSQFQPGRVNPPSGSPRQASSDAHRTQSIESLANQPVDLAAAVATRAGQYSGHCPVSRFGCVITMAADSPGTSNQTPLDAARQPCKADSA